MKIRNFNELLFLPVDVLDTCNHVSCLFVEMEMASPLKVGQFCVFARCFVFEAEIFQFALFYCFRFLLETDPEVGPGGYQE